MNESLTDRAAGGDYYLPGVGLVQVVPPGGVRYEGPLNDPVVAALLPRDDKGRFTVRDLARAGWVNTAATPLLPPTDIAGASFSCCANCSAAGPAERCSGCPRPRRTFNFALSTSEAQPRRWWPWRKD